jgi:riboflavin synthase
MFTGLVQAIGRVREVVDTTQAKRLVIEMPSDGTGGLEPRDLELGASVCVDGVCLTVVESRADEPSFAVDAAFETLRVTTLGGLERGSRVNLEPSLRLGDALGGHLVSGHVDGVGHLQSREERGEACEMWIGVPHDLARYVAVKGSICVAGISLTVNALREADGSEEAGFMVGIIPHTLKATTLGERAVGDPLNLEVDLLARYVERLTTGGVEGERRPHR